MNQRGRELFAAAICEVFQEDLNRTANTLKSDKWTFLDFDKNCIKSRTLIPKTVTTHRPYIGSLCRPCVTHWISLSSDLQRTCHLHENLLPESGIS